MSYKKKGNSPEAKVIKQYALEYCKNFVADKKGNAWIEPGGFTLLPDVGGGVFIAFGAIEIGTQQRFVGTSKFLMLIQVEKIEGTWKGTNYCFYSLGEFGMFQKEIGTKDELTQKDWALQEFILVQKLGPTKTISFAMGFHKYETALKSELPTDPKEVIDILRGCIWTWRGANLAASIFDANATIIGRIIQAGYYQQFKEIAAEKHVDSERVWLLLEYFTDEQSDEMLQLYGYPGKGFRQTVEWIEREKDPKRRKPRYVYGG